jgi:anti-sigma regulatory factor (Ser/Thr protein kinase)
VSSQELVPIGQVSRDLGISVSYVRRLTDEGLLPVTRTAGGHRRYDLGRVREAWVRLRSQAAVAPARPTSAPADAGWFPSSQKPRWQRSYSLDGLAEHLLFADLARALDLDIRTPAGGIAQYVVTEIVNNSIDHSDGTSVTIRAWATDCGLFVEVADDGVGAFARLSDGLGLGNRLFAIQELTKGKRTTDPAHHTGKGLFFSSKVVDVFSLEANGFSWTVDNLREDYSVGVVPAEPDGTTARFQVDPATERTTAEVFRRFTDDYAFTRTRPVVKLFEIGVTFVSRSEAKRLLAGLEHFTEVEVDFAGVDSVGQGFVDELLRVWPAGHPSTVILPTNMNEAVEFMVRRAQARPTERG